MTLHPEIQRKAQVQLDNVVGPNRLPQFSDRQYLTYIDCIIWEVESAVEAKYTDRPRAFFS